MKPLEFLPPDESQDGLAADVNKALPDGCRARFYRTKDERGEVRYGCVISFRQFNTTLTRDEAFFDDAALVRHAREWLAKVNAAGNAAFTYEPP